jgi:hypothetical protein
MDVDSCNDQEEKDDDDDDDGTTSPYHSIFDEAVVGGVKVASSGIV